MKITLVFRNPQSGVRSIEELFDVVASALTDVTCEVLRVPKKRITLANLARNLYFVHRRRGQINHITGDIHYVALVTGSRTILTIHDVSSSMGGSFIRRLFIMAFWFWLPALLVKRITAISEKTKNDLERIIPFARRKIRVVPNPYNPKLLEGFHHRQGEGGAASSRPIVLHLGTKSNKNLERTIRAMAGLPYELYIVGQPSAEQASLLAIHEVEFKSFFDLPYSEVASLYQQCSAVCFASLSEGFGMPIIEAQLVGRPVVTSGIDPMPWVAGKDGACLVDPHDVNSIREGISKVIEDQQYRQQLIEAGSTNVRRFEPTRIARMYEDVYREVSGD